MSVLGKIGAGATGLVVAGAGSIAGGLKNIAETAGKGFLQGAIGRTAAAGFTSGASASGAKASARTTATSGDADTDQIRALRDLQSDFADQKEVLKDIQFDMSMARETIGNIGVILVQSNMTLGKILDKLPGAFEKTISNAVTGAIAAASGLGAAGLGAAGTAAALKAAKPSAAATASVGATNAATAATAATAAKTTTKIAGKAVPLLGGVLSGGLEYAESGNIGKSIMVGGGSILGGIAGGTLGSFLAPGVGTVAGGIGGGIAGEAAGSWLYDRLFGSEKEKSEKMAELEEKEKEKEEEKKEKKDAAEAIKDSINFNSKEIVFKADNIKFEMVGGSGAGAGTGGAGGGGGFGPPPSGGGDMSGGGGMPAPGGAQGGAMQAPPSGGGAGGAAGSGGGGGGFPPPPAGASAAPVNTEPKSAPAAAAKGATPARNTSEVKTPPSAVKEERLADLSGGGGAMGIPSVAGTATDKPAPAAAPVKKDYSELKDLSGGIGGEGAYGAGSAIPDISASIQKSIDADNPGTQAPPSITTKSKTKPTTSTKVTSPDAQRVLSAGSKPAAVAQVKPNEPNERDILRSRALEQTGIRSKGIESNSGARDRANVALQGIQQQLEKNEKLYADGSITKEQYENNKSDYEGLHKRISATAKTFETNINGITERQVEANRALGNRGGKHADLVSSSPAIDTSGSNAVDNVKSMVGSASQPGAEYDMVTGMPLAGGAGIPVPSETTSGSRLGNASIAAEQQMRDAINRSASGRELGGNIQMPSQGPERQPESSTNEVPGAMLDDARLQSIFGFGA